MRPVWWRASPEPADFTVSIVPIPPVAFGYLASDGGLDEQPYCAAFPSEMADYAFANPPYVFVIPGREQSERARNP
jgi:hypothetical protein